MEKQQIQELKDSVKALAESDTEHILYPSEKYDAIFWFKRGAKAIINKL